MAAEMDDLERLLLARDAGLFMLPDGPVLLANPRPGPALSALASPALACVQGRRDAHDAIRRQGLDCHPTMPDAPANGFQAGLLLAMRNRVQMLGRLATVTQLTQAGGVVVVSGAKGDGIDSLASRLRGLIETERFAKGHGKVLTFRRPARLPAEFAEMEAEAQPAPNAEGFVTAPGMFSHAHSDAGSRALADHLVKALSGNVAEFGAGYGWLAHHLLRHNPAIAQMTLHEANHDSWTAARLNVTDPRAEMRWSDVKTLPGTDTVFDHVVTNPPFHDGRSPDPSLGQAFIAAAAQVLKPKGRLTLVANRHLPYEATLAAHFLEHRSVRDEGGYKILEATRPRRTRR